MDQSIVKTFSYQQKLSTFPLWGITAGQLLENVAKKYPDRAAVLSAYQSRSMTFGALLEKADRFAAGLMTIGIAKGAHVAIWSPNSIEWVVVSLACARGGFVLVQLNHSYKANELRYSVNKVNIKALIYGCNTAKQNYYNILKQVDLDMLEKGEVFARIKSAKMQSLDFIISLCGDEGTISYEEVFNKATQNYIDFIKSNQDKIDMDDPLNIQFTSGSTGNPKAAVLSHHSVINNAYSIGNRLELYKKHHSICVNVPFFHTFGTTAALFCCLNFGTTLVLPYDFYDPRKSLEIVAQYNCSIIYGTPTMYVDFMAQQDILNLMIEPDIICTGGAPSTPQLINDVYAKLKPKVIVNICGMTEGTAVFYQSYLNSDRSAVINNLGYLGDHIEAKVIDQNGNIVPIGTPGELCVRGYNTMLRYFDDELLTAQAFMKNRWLKTGDKFIMFDDGSGQLIGRIKDIIIRGGENIDPKEIEDYITAHPSVLDCHVVGVPHARLGEEICACIRVKPNMNVNLEEIKNYCQANLAHYKIPSKLCIFDEYPKTTSGKIQKYKLVEHLVQLNNTSLNY